MEKKKGSVMRLVAGILYMVYSLYQTWLFAEYMGKATFTSISLVAQAEILLAIVALIFGIYLIAGKLVPNEYVQRGAIAATVVITVFELITFTSQKLVIVNLLGLASSPLLEVPIWHAVFIFLRIVILILAAFFVLTPAEEKVAIGAEDEAEEDKMDWTIEDDKEAALEEEAKEEVKEEVKEKTKKKQTKLFFVVHNFKNQTPKHVLALKEGSV